MSSSSLSKLAAEWSLSGSGLKVRDLIAVAATPERASPFDASSVKRPRDATLELDEWRLPPEARDGARRERIFVARAVPGRVVSLTRTLLMAVNSDARAMESIMVVFEEFQRLNPRLSKEEALLLFGVDMVVQGMKASSAGTYARTIMSAFRRRGEPMQGPLVGDFLKIVELIMAGEETEHANDISADLGRSLVESMEGPRQTAAWLMLVAGIRCADLQHMKPADFRFESDGRLHVYFRFSKNHRSRSERFSIICRPAFFPQGLTELFGRPRDGPLFPAPVSVHDLNGALRSAAARLGVEGDVTSYSLRRVFIHAVIAKNVEGDYVNWMNVVKSTGHHAIEVLRTAYASKFDNSM